MKGACRPCPCSQTQLKCLLMVTEMDCHQSSAAARAGQLDVLQLLLSAGASIAHVDFDGTTALAHASTKGHAEVVQALIAAGADPAASDLSSASPLKMAIRQGHLDVSSILIRHEYAVDLCECGVASCEWLATLCANAQEVSVKQGRCAMQHVNICRRMVLCCKPFQNPWECAVGQMSRK